VITNLENTNNNWIYQSNKLIEASYFFTVLEQKLIRVLASMIKKDDIDFKEYKFAAKDLSKLLNIDNKNIYMELDKITDRLMSRYIKIKNDNNKKFKKRHLIKMADFENGVLTLKIDEDMKEFYLKLNWYTKYQLKNILQFKSTYSFRLYELLKQYENIGCRILTIQDLRFILDIEKNKYPKYANLKQKTISVALKEINAHTDLYIGFEEIKESRKITSLKFYIKSNNNISNETVQIKQDLDVYQHQPTEDQYIKKVKSIMYDHEITSLEAKKIYDSSKGNFQLIERVYSNFKNKQLDNFVGTMISMVKPFAFKEPKYNAAKLSVNDYDQRPFDPTLERRLLGLDESNEV
jgi:plasmid replication initiation protein